jgi:hypothetical protein
MPASRPGGRDDSDQALLVVGDGHLEGTPQPRSIVHQRPIKLRTPRRRAPAEPIDSTPGHHQTGLSPARASRGSSIAGLRASGHAGSAWLGQPAPRPTPDAKVATRSIPVRWPRRVVAHLLLQIMGLSSQKATNSSRISTPSATDGSAIAHRKPTVAGSGPEVALAPFNPGPCESSLHPPFRRRGVGLPAEEKVRKMTNRDVHRLHGPSGVGP